MLVTADGTSRGTVGGAGLEERVKNLCKAALASGEGGVHTFDLANWKQGGLDSVCGGTVTIAIHVVRSSPRILVVGGGHVAQALGKILDVLAYPYTIVDSRPGFAEKPEVPAAFIRRAEELPYSHAYLLGHSHHEDGDALIALLERGFPGVIGVIGSKSKMHAFGERARERGLTTQRVRCPIGAEIGADSPPEIAVAVAAEIVRDLKLAAQKPSQETLA